MIVMTEDEEEPSPATLELLEVVHTLAKVAPNPITYVHAVSLVPSYLCLA